MALDSEQIAKVNGMNPEQRMQYLFKQCVAEQAVWILTDEHGCVMLNTDDEDCVPVWPDQAFAEQWATGDWQDCKAKSIALEKWLQKWTPGLLDDELAVVIFPQPGEDGLVIDPEELDFELNQQLKKQRRR
ncbi:DUF2750 domain-containing protein [Motilimonas pumila]|uniref:DUF2750 domain-containing protein n=1 Tax=Motilimonas pumila TaxID=2303987 RepID=A0A418YFK7_9GAMM|nr:DUF2750 domain-containing protein [Motilimonas pumila]RJG48089.1 DUF2750 domain-containing protein [Motilimonas pumila]